MTELFIEEYYKNIAIRNKLLKHTAEAPTFYRVIDGLDLEEFDNAVRNMRKSRCLILEMGDGEISEWDSQVDTPRIGLHVLIKTDETFANKNAARDEAKKLLLQIISQMRYDSKGRYERADNQEGPLKAISSYFDTKLKYTNMTAVDGNWYGKSLFIEIKAPVNLEYNQNDWEDPA